ncbi:PREDICTED: LOW QUALITY PROTEIN: peptide methionine sulfoxide reductase B9 [Camelina sativa]|uniref:LOW QUALITY PROTEIN: peptide methionine sulfoxide reductase B9 n=1 Tax=Camelina sativa TaxID=90675 RepID=A0ABM1QM11_CAMSA|nr:PREDICTED: LOW QUALITY PROTEIN: peptide methionine sulfoxide reductase B9 [Camelina sativa]
MLTSATLVAPSTGSFQKKDQEWRAILSPEQFRVLREKGTAGRGKGEYTKLFDDGTYSCAGCATPLYKSTTIKFDSGCGWPSFFDAIPGAIKQTLIDISFCDSQLF